MLHLVRMLFFCLSVSFATVNMASTQEINDPGPELEVTLEYNVVKIKNRVNFTLTTRLGEVMFVTCRRSRNFNEFFKWSHVQEDFVIFETKGVRGDAVKEQVMIIQLTEMDHGSNVTCHNGNTTFSIRFMIPQLGTEVPRSQPIFGQTENFDCKNETDTFYLLRKPWNETAYLQNKSTLQRLEKPNQKINYESYESRLNTEYWLICFQIGVAVFKPEDDSEPENIFSYKVYYTRTNFTSKYYELVRPTTAPVTNSTEVTISSGPTTEPVTNSTEAPAVGSDPGNYTLTIIFSVLGVIAFLIIVVIIVLRKRIWPPILHTYEEVQYTTRTGPTTVPVTNSTEATAVGSDDQSDRIYSEIAHVPPTSES